MNWVNHDDIEYIAGNIYRFSSNTINTDEEHRFVLCVVVEGHANKKIAHFVCCTSQEETIKHLIRTKGYCQSTIPVFKPTIQNKFTKGHTYVNCNELKSHTIVELDDKITEGKFEPYGNISEGDFEQIRTAMFNSDHIPDIYPKNMVYGKFFDFI